MRDEFMPKVYIDRDLEELIPDYLKDRHLEIQKLRVALDDSDFEFIERIAHQIKGNAGSYGFDLLSSIGSQMEQDCIKGRYSKLSSYLAQMQDYLDNLEIEYFEEED